MTETVEERARHLLMPFRDDIITCQKRFKTLQSGIAQALRTERDKALEEAAVLCDIDSGSVIHDGPGPGFHIGGKKGAELARAIRNLKSKSE